MRVAEASGKTYVIKKNHKDSLERRRGLILAAKSGLAGTFDAEFMRQFYNRLLPILPGGVAERLIINKSDELLEKLEEVTQNNLPKSYEIARNISREVVALSKTFNNNMPAERDKVLSKAIDLCARINGMPNAYEMLQAIGCEELRNILAISNATRLAARAGSQDDLYIFAKLFINIENEEKKRELLSSVRLERLVAESQSDSEHEGIGSLQDRLYFIGANMAFEKKEYTMFDVFASKINAKKLSRALRYKSAKLGHKVLKSYSNYLGIFGGGLFAAEAAAIHGLLTKNNWLAGLGICGALTSVLFIYAIFQTVREHRNEFMNLAEERER